MPCPPFTNSSWRSGGKPKRRCKTLLSFKTETVGDGASNPAAVAAAADANDRKVVRCTVLVAGTSGEDFSVDISVIMVEP